MSVLQMYGMGISYRMVLFTQPDHHHIIEILLNSTQVSPQDTQEEWKVSHFWIPVYSAQVGDHE